MSFRITFFAIAAALLSGCSDRTEPPDIEGEITSVMEAQVDAWNAGDIHGFMDGYWHSDDMIFAGGGTFFAGWDTLLSRYEKNYPEGGMGTLSFSDVEVHRISTDAAWVVGKWTVKKEDDVSHGAFTLIFRRMPDGWKIVHDHTSSVKKIKSE